MEILERKVAGVKGDDMAGMVLIAGCDTDHVDLVHHGQYQQVPKIYGE